MNAIELFWSIGIVYEIVMGYLCYKFVEPLPALAWGLLSFIPLLLGFIVNEKLYTELPNTRIVKFEATGRLVVFWDKESWKETMDFNLYMLPDNKICIRKEKRTDAYTNESFGYSVKKCD